MARGFSGMKDDFMEIINHIIGLSCCSVAHDDNDGTLLPLPQPTVRDFACLEVSQVFSASDTEVRDAAGTEDVPRSDLTCTARVDDSAYSVISTGPSFPRAEYVVIDEGLDPGFAAVRNTLYPTFDSEENFWRGSNASLNIKLYEKDSEFLPSSQIEKEKNSNPKIIEKKSSSRSLNSIDGNEVDEKKGITKEISFESASDIEDYYLYSKKEGENFSIQKHILVEDHMASISLSKGIQLRKRTNKNLDDEDIRDYNEADGFEYVIV